MASVSLRPLDSIVMHKGGIKAMNIININSAIEITHSQKSLIEEVLLCDYHPMFVEDSFWWLSKEIPIFLMNEDSMKKYDSKNECRYEHNFETKPHTECRYERNFETKPHTEWLGFYGRDSSGLFEHTPRIAICPERIANCVQDAEKFMFLLAKVIVHEFAHATMDWRDQNTKYRKKDDFWHWMEESTANKLTLEVFRNFSRGFHHRRYRAGSVFTQTSWGDKLFDFIIDFVKKQPPEYALGFELFEKGIGSPWMWSDNKDQLGGKKRINKKTHWLSYMKNNYKNIDEKISEKLYDDLFGLR